MGHIPTAAKMGLLGGFLERLENNRLGAGLFKACNSIEKLSFSGKLPPADPVATPPSPARQPGRWPVSERRTARDSRQREAWPGRRCIRSRPGPLPPHRIQLQLCKDHVPSTARWRCSGPCCSSTSFRASLLPPPPVLHDISAGSSAEVCQYILSPSLKQPGQVLPLLPKGETFCSWIPATPSHPAVLPS
jgi:hypothetical protein